jgi:hypothetical protein
MSTIHCSVCHEALDQIPGSLYDDIIQAGGRVGGFGGMGTLKDQQWKGWVCRRCSLVLCFKCVQYEKCKFLPACPQCGRNESIVAAGESYIPHHPAKFDRETSAIKHRAEVQEQRRSVGKCIMCSGPLKFMDKLLGRDHHNKCTEFTCRCPLCSPDLSAAGAPSTA